MPYQPQSQIFLPQILLWFGFPSTAVELYHVRYSPSAGCEQNALVKTRANGDDPGVVVV